MKRNVLPGLAAATASRAATKSGSDSVGVTPLRLITANRMKDCTPFFPASITRKAGTLMAPFG